MPERLNWSEKTDFCWLYWFFLETNSTKSLIWKKTQYSYKAINKDNNIDLHKVYQLLSKIGILSDCNKCCVYNLAGAVTEIQ